MEPELPRPRPAAEQTPVQYEQPFERAPLLRTPEQGIERGTEQFERASEAAARQADSSAVAAPPQVLPSVVAPPPVAEPVVAANDTPIVASDDDLIEKEWVDKAKQIIVETKDDPYRREEAVSKLQADYLKKRYGRELGVAE